MTPLSYKSKYTSYIDPRQPLSEVLDRATPPGTTRFVPKGADAFETKVWNFIRYYRYPSSPAEAVKDPVNRRNFELRVFLEFPADWTREDVLNRERELIDFTDEIMRVDAWEEANRRYGHDVDIGEILMDHLSSVGFGGVARGIEEGERRTRAVEIVECDDPYYKTAGEPRRFRIGVAAWQEIYDRIIYGNEKQFLQHCLF